MPKPAYNGAISPKHLVLPIASQIPAGMKGLNATIQPDGEQVVICYRDTTAKQVTKTLS